MRIRGHAGGELALLPVSGFRREHARHDLPHHRHDRTPEGGVFQPPPAGAAYARHHRGIRNRPGPGPHRPGRRLHAADADVSRPRLGQPLRPYDARQQTGLSGALCAGCPAGIDRARGGDLHPLRADDPADAAVCAWEQGCRSFEAEDGYRRLRHAARARQGRDGARNRRFHRLWAIRNPARCCPVCI